MDMVRNRLFQNLRENRLGQSTVEYILLLALTTIIIIGVLKSDAFQSILGEDSEFFGRLGKMVQFSYRHGHMGTREERDSDNYDYSSKENNHKSYRAPDKDSRLFIPTEVYPR